MTSRSRQQVLIGVSVHPHGVHRVLKSPPPLHMHLPFPTAHPEDLKLQHQAQRQLPFRGSLTSAHNCVMSDPGNKSLYGYLYVLMDLLL